MRFIAATVVLCAIRKSKRFPADLLCALRMCSAATNALLAAAGLLLAPNQPTHVLRTHTVECTSALRSKRGCLTDRLERTDGTNNLGIALQFERRLRRRLLLLRRWVGECFRWCDSIIHTFIIDLRLRTKPSSKQTTEKTHFETLEGLQLTEFSSTYRYRCTAIQCQSDCRASCDATANSSDLRFTQTRWCHRCRSPRRPCAVR
jgi:hypothetical protein